MSMTNEVMIAREPGQISKAFEAAYNSGIIENLFALYEPETKLVALGSGPENRNPDGTARDWRAELVGLMQLGGQIECNCRFALPNGDIALISGEWRVYGLKDAEGNPLPEMTGRSVEVVRRQADGRWLYFIDHPIGASV